MECPQAWERLLWRGRSRGLPRTEYALTDIRLVAYRPDRLEELTLYDIDAIEQTRTWMDRRLGTSTLTVSVRNRRRAPMTLRRIREADQVAGLLELLTASDSSHPPDLDAVLAAAAGRPGTSRRRRDRVTGMAGLVVLVAVVGGVLARQRSVSVAQANAEGLLPVGATRTQVEMMRFMEETVMPWARTALAPIVGGPDRVRCETCHGVSGPVQAWRMPAVAALPEEAVRDRGWEHYSDGMDPQLRNAIYGYGAQSDKQTRAAYMREVVMPGMAQVLGRPAYDFTRPYDFNRRRQAFGCYHCHNVR